MRSSGCRAPPDTPKENPARPTDDPPGWRRRRGGGVLVEEAGVDLTHRGNQIADVVTDGDRVIALGEANWRPVGPADLDRLRHIRDITPNAGVPAFSCSRRREAAAANVLLRAVLAMAGPEGAAISADDAERAARFLAERAHRALGDGLDGGVVASRWARRWCSAPGLWALQPDRRRRGLV